MTSPFNGLMQKEMDRKDFLRHIAAAMLMVAGAGLIGQSIQKASKLASGSHTSKSDASVYGYGGSVYGGMKANRR